MWGIWHMHAYWAGCDIPNPRRTDVLPRNFDQPVAYRTQFAVVFVAEATRELQLNNKT